MYHKNNFSDIFPEGKLSVLIDASSLIRIHDFENSIKLYSKYFALFTTDFNKSELEYITNNETERSSLLLDRMLEVAKLSSPSNGYIRVVKAINRINSRSLERYKSMVMRAEPENNLSSIDIILMYIVSKVSDKTILLTSDTQLRQNAELHGLCSMGPLYLDALVKICNEMEVCPITTNEVRAMYPQIKAYLHSKEDIT